MEFDVRTYGESFADVYDDWYADVSDVAATVACLDDLAGSGPVLELGVGSGRLATPLAELGHRVIGLDASAAMLGRIDADSTVVPVLGDMAAPPFRPGTTFSLAFVAFNTFFNLTNERSQQRCLTTVAQLLAPGAPLVVEAFVPAIGLADVEPRLTPAQVAAEHQVLTSSQVDTTTQVITGLHVEMLDGGRVKRRPWQVRYATPPQIDAMAAVAGLTLAERWSDWSGTVFDEASDSHVSIYRRT